MQVQRCQKPDCTIVVVLAVVFFFLSEGGLGGMWVLGLGGVRKWGGGMGMRGIEEQWSGFMYYGGEVVRELWVLDLGGVSTRKDGDTGYLYRVRILWWRAFFVLAEMFGSVLLRSRLL